MTQFLGSVTCRTRKIRGRVLIDALEMPRIAKILSNDNIVPQSIVTWKKFTWKKKERESEEGQKYWEILGQKKLLGKKRSTQTSEILVGWTSRWRNQKNKR